nr:hypothetical protein [Tanacetum cinerariifolium]
MSDLEDSIITYTAVSSPYGGLSDIGSLGVDRLPVMPEDPYTYVVAAFQAPPSPDYKLGPNYPPLPEFIPEPVYPEFMPAEDDILPAEEQLLPNAASPTAKSPGYIDKFDPEDDPEEDPKDDPEEDPADYPADGGEEGDDEDESSDDEEDESSDDDEDKDIDIEGETELFETDESAATPPPHPAYRVTARKSIRPQTYISFPSDTEISRLMAIPTPPPSPLSPLSSPLLQIPSPPLPLLSPPPTDPTYEEEPLGYRRLCTAHTGTYELGESSASTAARFREPVRDDLYRFLDTVEQGEGSTPAAMEVGYGITDTWDDLRRDRMTRLYKEPESTGYSGIGDSMLTLVDS